MSWTCCQCLLMWKQKSKALLGFGMLTNSCKIVPKKKKNRRKQLFQKKKAGANHYQRAMLFYLCNTPPPPTKKNKTTTHISSKPCIKEFHGPKILNYCTFCEYFIRQTYLLHIFSTHTNSSFHDEWMAFKNLSTVRVNQHNNERISKIKCSSW